MTFNQNNHLQEQFFNQGYVDAGAYSSPARTGHKVIMQYTLFTHTLTQRPI